MHHVNFKPEPCDIGGYFVEKFWRKNLCAGVPLFGHVSIGLIITCRQVYAEAVGFLSSSNVFNVHEGYRWPFKGRCGTSRHLSSIESNIYVKSQYLCQIRQLELDWRFKELLTGAYLIREEQDQTRPIIWTSVWREIGKELLRLRLLFVRIVIRGDIKRDVGDEMQWAAPVLKLGRNLETCKVSLLYSSILPKAVFELKNFEGCMRTQAAVTCNQKSLEIYPMARTAWIVA